MSTDYSTVSIALVLVIARLYTKYFLTKTPGWEDRTLLPTHMRPPLVLMMYTIVMSVAALLLAIARVACDALGTFIPSPSSQPPTRFHR